MKNRIVRSVAALGVAGAAVIGFGASAANADVTVWELEGENLTGNTCFNWGENGERAGAWIDYECIPYGNTYDLWVRLV